MARRSSPVELFTTTLTLPLTVSLHHNTTSTGRAPSTRSYIEMANDDDKQKQVHDDKNISGPLLCVLPHSAFQHPPRVVVLNPMDNGMIERYVVQYMDQYIGQLGRNQLVVSTFVGLLVVLFRYDDTSCSMQFAEILGALKKDDQIINGIITFGAKDWLGMAWLISNKSEDKEAKTKSKPLDDMAKDKET